MIRSVRCTTVAGGYPSVSGGGWLAGIQPSAPKREEFRTE